MITDAGINVLASGWLCVNSDILIFDITTEEERRIDVQTDDAPIHPVPYVWTESYWPQDSETSKVRQTPANPS